MTAPARCLDLTRLTARAGRALTGVDRVELAYLDRFLASDVPLWGFVRTRIGFLILDRSGLREARPRLAGEVEWPSADLVSRLSWRLNPARARAEAGLRRLARTRVTRAGLGRSFARLLPPDTAFFQTGLMNVTPRTLAAIRAVPQARVAIFVHDTIPLDFPDYARPGAGERLQALLDVASGADLILCPSGTAAGTIRARVASSVPVRGAPLGVVPAVPDRSALPPDLDLSTPYFVALGTIEARKDIALLLDVWEDLPQPRPRLYLCGARGWRVEAETARLDAGIPGVTELPGLTDGAVAALLGGARALLFPSRAEGFGLPPFEALAQGTLPVCADLAIWRETLGDRAVYLPPGDRYPWRRTIEDLASAPRRPVDAGALPTWDDHFKLALTAGW